MIVCAIYLKGFLPKMIQIGCTSTLQRFNISRKN